MYDDDRDDDDEKRPPAYTAVVGDQAWTSTRTLAIEGTVFRHTRHPADVPPGIQHKLLVWLCETRRPATHCPCGLYALQWLDDDHEGRASPVRLASIPAAQGRETTRT